MNPWLLLFSPCSSAIAKIGPGPWNPSAFASREHDLKKLKRPDVEGCNRTCQVKTPHPGELGSESPCHGVIGTLKPVQPIFQGLGVMGSKIFYIQGHSSQKALVSPSLLGERARMPPGRSVYESTR